MLGVSYTFLAYVWFILCNDFLTTNKLPKFLEIFATKVLKRIWFWKFDNVEPFYRIFWKASVKGKTEEKGNKSKIYNITNDNLDLVLSNKNEMNGEFSFLKAKTDLNLNNYNNMSTILPVVINSNSSDENTKNDPLKLNSAPGGPTYSANLPKSKCNSCDLCENCQKDKQKDKDKKKKKDLVESNVSALNHFACFILICIELLCNLTVWLIISYPPNSY